MPRLVFDKPTKPFNGKIEQTRSSRALISIGPLILVARGYAENFTHVPGGHIDANETPESALHRELTEEIGRPIASYQLVQELDHEFIRNWDGTLEKQHSYIYLVKLYPVITEQGQQSKESKLTYEWHQIHELWRANLQPPEMISIIQRYCSM